jgi:hypothetical protein
MSLRINPAVKMAAYNAGANECFTKPLSARLLAKTIYIYSPSKITVLLLDSDKFMLETNA